jgi:hypothetical protein
MRYLNELEEFVKGTYKGEDVYEVAEAYPDYLQHLLENCSIDAEDREIINSALGITEEE